MKLLPLASVLLACRAFAQNPSEAQSFEVASIRILASSQGPPIGLSSTPHRSGGRISWTTNLGLFLRYAYDLPDWRIVRRDKDQSFYAIDATFDAAASEDQVRLMLQKLLAERFKLAVHREEKEVEGYVMVVNKNGPKMKAAAPGEDHAMPDYLAGKTPAAFEGHIFVSMEGPGTSAITARGVSIAQLADTLSATLSTAVLDKTGLSGNFYFGLKFLAVNGSPADDAGASTIFSALQDELGLKLEKQKLIAGMLVIDHFEPPSEN